jgi:hypothetical protein
LGGTALLGGGLDWMRDMITINGLYIIITGYLGWRKYYLRRRAVRKWGSGGRECRVDEME